MNLDVANLPRAHGKPVFTSVLKQSCADFRVSELLDIDFSDRGEHLFLQVEKTGMNTLQVKEMLQSAYQLGSVDVGLSGLKDRQSVSVQWFSMRTHQDAKLAAERFAAHQVPGEQVRLVQARRHHRKLRRGTHYANAFSITLNDVRSTADGSLESTVALRLETLSSRGFPNFIGAQRFGMKQRNLYQAQRWFQQPRKRVSRQQRSLWLSAARSAVFNEVCAARVADTSWEHILEGEPVCLQGSRSYFCPSPQEYESSDLLARLASMDVHTSAPWWGRGRTIAGGACERYETALLSSMQSLCEGLERAGLNQERRALRATASELEHKWLDGQTLRVSFSLAPGVFATTLLNELGECVEPVHERHSSQ